MTVKVAMIDTGMVTAGNQRRPHAAEEHVDHDQHET